jgi:3D (Asp-Asp-Asp) domain-containing protein
MRILASVVLTGMILANVQIAKAEISKETDQNIQQKSNQEQSTENIKSTIFDIKSYNLNFATAAYIAEINPKFISSYSRIKLASYVNLSKNGFVINASAYTAAADECGKSDGITASGLRVRENKTLACPKQYPFGTKIQIDGMGNYVCEDRGGAIKGNHFDIYMQSKKQAFAFGRRNLIARVVE